MIARFATKSTDEDDQSASPPPRPPVLQRLGPSPCEKVAELGDSLSEHNSGSQDRLPATLRLGIHEARQTIGEEFESQGMRSSERLPASQRLGPPHPREPASIGVVPATKQRKPGRPPGSGKNKEKKTASNVVPKRRIVSQKPSPARRKSPSNATPPPPSKVAKATKPRAGSSRRGLQQSEQGTTSENAPIINLIPKSTRRKMDFRAPSPPPVP